MTTIQFIERDGHAEFAVVPIEIWNRVAALVEDLDDVALFDKAKAADDGFRVPAEVLEAELAGAHPIRAWREHRGLTQDQLSEASGISKPYLSQIESGKRNGTYKKLAAISKALGVPVDVLGESQASPFAAGHEARRISVAGIGVKWLRNATSCQLFITYAVHNQA